MSRPEDNLPPDLFYDARESAKYTTSSRIQRIQSDMTQRALDLLALPSPALILDIGCGSGLSGEILSAVPAAEGGPHTWVGMDISGAMLDVALSRGVEGDLLLADAGQGVPFRPGTFDAAISISALQWLCNEDSSDLEARAEARLRRFFATLYASLRRGGRAVCQFYARDATQRSMISSAAVRAGFGAGLLEDDAGTKSAKTYLVLTVGGGDITSLVSGMPGVDVQDGRPGRTRSAPRNPARSGSKAWVALRKEKALRRGKVVKADSKYTGRKRRPAF